MSGFTLPGFMRNEKQKSIELTIRHYAAFPPDYTEPRSIESYYATVEFLPKIAYPYELLQAIHEGMVGYA